MLLGVVIILSGGITAVLCLLVGRAIEAGQPGYDPNQLTAMISGLLAGSLTSTPAFSATKEAVAAQYQDAVTVGYGIAYLFGVIGGCGPAFAYMFIDAMARAGVKNGMKKDTALMVAAQTVLGSAKMILESSEHPWELIDKVCSPGGTTIEAVTSLQADGFESAIHNAIDKAVDKDSKL